MTGFNLHGITDGCRSPGSSPNSATNACCDLGQATSTFCQMGVLGQGLSQGPSSAMKTGLGENQGTEARGLLAHSRVGRKLWALWFSPAAATGVMMDMSLCWGPWLTPACLRRWTLCRRLCSPTLLGDPCSRPSGPSSPAMSVRFASTLR